MRLKGRLNKEEFEGLTKDNQAFYEKDEERDVWYLKDGETENVDGLKSALNSEREVAKKRKEALDKFQNVDPEKYRQLMEEEQALEARRAEIEEKVNATNSEWQKKLDRELGKVNTRNQSLMSALEQALVDNALLQAAGDKILSPKIWLQAAKGHVRLKEEKSGDGLKFMVEVIDPETKVPRMSAKTKDSSPMSIDELVEDLGTQDDFKPLYKAAPAHGSGATVSKSAAAQNPGGIVRISREDARDPGKYRAAKERAAKEQLPFEVEPIELPGPMMPTQ